LNNEHSTEINMARNSNTKKRSGSSARSAGSSHSEDRNGATGAASRRRRGSTQARRNPGSQQFSQRQSMPQSMSSRALSMITEHPIPAAMIGAGLAMLLLENRSGLANIERQMMRRGGALLDSARESLSDYSSTAREALSGAAEYVGESLGPVSESFSQGKSRLGEYLSGGASSVGQSVESAYEYGRDALADAWERHPIMLCASILGAGLAAGLLLPATRRENSLLGRTSDAVARKIREQGRELMNQGREMANEAVQNVAQSVTGLGLSLGTGGGATSRARASSGGGSKSKRSRRPRRTND
jgi:hypothetical protein